MTIPDVVPEKGAPDAERGAFNSVVELRRYRLRPGSRDTLIDLFDRELVETQEAAGMCVIGQFRDLDEPDSFVWLRGFAGMASRERALRTFYSGPVWAVHRDAANATMINSDNVLLLRPLSPENTFMVTDATRPPRGTTGSRPGLVVATVAHLAPHTDVDFADFFTRDVLPILSKSGATLLGSFVVDRSQNTFPRLPVREGETLFVWLSSFRDEAAYGRHVDSLAAMPEWAQRVLPEMDRRLWRPNEVSRLVPTARSLVHHDGVPPAAIKSSGHGEWR